MDVCVRLVAHKGHVTSLALAVEVQIAVRCHSHIKKRTPKTDEVGWTSKQSCYYYLRKLPRRSMCFSETKRLESKRFVFLSSQEAMAVCTNYR